MLKILHLQSKTIIRTLSTVQSNRPVQYDLTKYFINKIKINGPITVAEYMRESLKVYYNSSKVFGSDGDFITSPEISQLYGEVSKYVLITIMHEKQNKKILFFSFFITR